ncbi:MAG: type VI secretion system tube protein Hcp [Pseudomonadota bacterium]|nr:type VI secretion system tube protein Hcp [Pseudomonadota bacterium]
MSRDVYLHIDGNKGSSADAVHAGWSALISAQWGVTPPESATASTGEREIS